MPAFTCLRTYGGEVTSTSLDLTDLHGRLNRARDESARAGLDALVISPGPDLSYLTGYDAIALERLTALVLPTVGEACVIVPTLEAPAAKASPIGDLGLPILTWDETDDPYQLVAKSIGVSRSQRGPVVAVDNHMWAEKVLRLRHAMPEADQRLAGVVLNPMRMRKTSSEIESLRQAGAAIDRVHAQVSEFLRAGRTEREVGRDIADAIIQAGHTRVDFVIVASGPNGASPHAEVSDRKIDEGEPVVVDIGGTMPDGYCSDSTRNYCIGAPPPEYVAYFDVLQAAQEVAVNHVRPGVTCESVDEAGRAVLRAAGLGDHFIHRIGHGIGLETHEDPYLVAGNTALLEPGFAFSVEPGVYFGGRHGARIEDIVVCTETGVDSMNLRPHELVIC